MMSNGWEWSTVASAQSHVDRVAMIREIPYETTNIIEFEDQAAPMQGLPFGERGKALSINISSGGMLLLTDKAVHVDQVLRIHVPTPVNHANIPTLAEVRWVRPLPFPAHGDLYFVGLRFLF